jgi:hypothetical protein
LTDIKIVSDLDNKALLKYADTAKKIAKEVHGTSLEIAEASTIFFQ